MTAGTQVRGQPLVALLAVAGGWIGGRAITWEPPTLIQEAVASEGARGPAGVRQYGPLRFDATAGPQSAPQASLSTVHDGREQSPQSDSRFLGNGAGLEERSYNAPGRTAPAWLPVIWDLADLTNGPAAAGFGPDRLPRVGIYDLPGVQLAAQPAPPSVVGSGANAARIPAGPDREAGAAVKPKRWSGDAWALIRGSGNVALVKGALPATYGASQSGAVLRYRIAPGSAYRPTAYLRSTSTLGTVRQTSAALGISARPVPGLPIVGAVEGRMTDDAGTRRFQPVAMAVTELAPFGLAMGLRGEAYGQAGYVGGKFATAFADGQIRADRDLFSAGRFQARLGAGMWGGVQEGAGRLDFGPSATVTGPLGRGAFGRLAFDWRFRFLGNANPDSGPAVTLSAGF
ncbi:hypothetical protein [Novosphingobium sp. PY1]|uniref:hypothetical protein n=1 Tax=Novosphingobium sp. PY1 TaxID=1882221 RepID=UPI001A8D8189|nr:hypothetical protein [Novosphingobium sp. PY1]GFM29963.1 putative uncharacterized protein [Novosphingobium sp. PY1]